MPASEIGVSKSTYTFPFFDFLEEVKLAAFPRSILTGADPRTALHLPLGDLDLSEHSHSIARTFSPYLSF